MKRVCTLLLILLMALSPALPALAAGGQVTYDGDARQFIFQPGSDYSPTDLFPDFKDVMPGDSLTQPITVKNEASNGVKVKIYMRALGAHENSVDFLSQLRLRVEKAANNTMAYMFDAAANESAQLTDWVLLGTLYSGGEVELNVLLDVPVELDNQYSDQIGYLDWEFMVEEFPIEEDDPKAPETGENSKVIWWIIAAIVAATLLILLAQRRRDNNDR